MTNKPIPIPSDRRMSGLRERRSRAPATEGELTASLAHEINNPLATLLNLLYLIEPEAALTEKGRKYLLLAREEIDRISQIAHTAMHDFRDIVPCKANLTRVLGDVLDLYKVRFESRGVSVMTRYCSRGDIFVYPGLLRQMFSNLLLNATDAMPNGGRLHARITGAQEWAGQKRRGLRVTIADTGCGIPADKLLKIFEPFFTTKGDRGNGLGLSLVKNVVARHGGVLRVRSSTQRGRSGSVIAIFLPAA